jgi:hypothetical protein
MESVVLHDITSFCNGLEDSVELFCGVWIDVLLPANGIYGAYWAQEDWDLVLCHNDI